MQLKLIQGRGSYQIIDFTVPRMLNGPVRRHRENMLDVFFGNLMVNIDRVGIGANEENEENEENHEMLGDYTLQHGMVVQHESETDN